jgi:hypothetical protein
MAETSSRTGARSAHSRIANGNHRAVERVAEILRKMARPGGGLPSGGGPKDSSLEKFREWRIRRNLLANSSTPEYRLRRWAGGPFGSSNLPIRPTWMATHDVAR